MEQNDPMDPMLKALPIEPMEQNDPMDPIELIDPGDLCELSKPNRQRLACAMPSALDADESPVVATASFFFRRRRKSATALPSTREATAPTASPRTHDFLTIDASLQSQSKITPTESSCRHCQW
jgi:hypothetical protein